VATWVVWLLLGGSLLLAEMFTLTFYLLWLGLGAVVGATVAFMVPSLWIQVVCASVASLILTIFSKRIVGKFRIGKGFKDAVDTIVGREAVVTQDIRPKQNGIVKVGGDTWSATANEDIVIGEKVVVVSRQNTVLTVRRAN
jgi:membrane protein implicated in regulation of membrane protease activity